MGGRCHEAAGITLQGVDHGVRGRVAAAFGVRAAEHHVAGFAAFYGPRQAASVERGIVAAVAAHRARGMTEQEHWRGGVRSLGQHGPACSRMARGHVGEQRPGDMHARRARAEWADRSRGMWAGEGECALDGDLPGRR